MKAFEKFAEYMYYLFNAPFKQVKEKMNAWYIFCVVIGKYFDNVKAAFFSSRESSMVATASERFLTDLHGNERGMLRLKGEDIENYRTRLMLKFDISQKAGTVEGILLTASSLGYDATQIIPLYLSEPDKWAEFNLMLSGKSVSSINEINVITEEINKVKPASSKCNIIFYTPSICNIYVGAGLIYGEVITNRQVN